MNLHQDIETSVTAHFAFLQEMGFPPFKTEQLAYEIHFRCKRDGVRVDVWYEMIYSTPVWVTVNGLHVPILESENAIIQGIYDSKDELYKANFQKYLKEDDASCLKKNEVLYRETGALLNDAFLEEVSHILQRNRDVLQKESNRMAEIQDGLTIARKIEHQQFSKANGIYTCEYDWIGLTCWHEGTLEEIEAHLLEHADGDLTQIVIFDPEGKVVEERK